MAKVPNAVEILQKNLNRLSRAHERYRQTTDRQTTDGQTTDGRAIAYSEREREFTFAKNLIYIVSQESDANIQSTELRPVASESNIIVITLSSNL